MDASSRVDLQVVDKEYLKALQAPLKAKYRDDPNSALVTLRAEGLASEGVSCSLEVGRALVNAGLHQAAGGDGSQACSGDMLLQALVACVGVTLRAVATSLGIPMREARIVAEGDLDLRHVGRLQRCSGRLSRHPVADPRRYRGRFHDGSKTHRANGTLLRSSADAANPCGCDDES